MFEHYWVLTQVIPNFWDTFLRCPDFFCNVPELSCVSRKNFPVSLLQEKSPDSRNNFGFVQKQRLLELSPPVLLTNQSVRSISVIL